MNCNNCRFNGWLALLSAGFFFVAGTVGAVPITGITINSVSSEFTAGDRTAVKTIDGSGITGTAHDTNATAMWFTDGGVETTPTGFVVYDLGAAYPLSNIRVWNYNESGPVQPLFGAKEVEISVSSDDNVTNLVALDNGGGDFEFPKATGAPGYTGFDVDMSGVTNSSLLDSVRLVKLEILGSWREEPYLGVNYVGLSEVRFDTGAYPKLIVDRDNGKISIKNEGVSDLAFESYTLTSATGSFDPSAWTTITDHYDMVGPGDGSVDMNDDWSILSATPHKLSESESPVNDGGTITAGETVDLSTGNGAWLRSPVEDVLFEINASGQVYPYFVDFVDGPNNTSYPRSDFDYDGNVTGADWTIFADNFLSDLTGLSSTQAYLKSDINRDGVSDVLDFEAFELDYDAANGAGAFAALLAGVPEPASCLLFGLGALVTLSLRTRPVMGLSAHHLGVLLCFVPAILFVAASTVCADKITGVSIQDFSSQYDGGGIDTRFAENIINESGLVDDMHDSTQWHMWFTDGLVETTPTGFVTIDLGANHALGNIHVWNYNETGSIQPGFGAKDVEIWVGPDDNATNLVKLDNLGGDFVFPMATGVSDYTGFDVDVSGVTNSSLLDNVRLVKFEILDSWREEVGFPAVNFVGLAEVRFEDPSNLTAVVNRATGDIALRNNTIIDTSFDFYHLTSAGGSLDPTWIGLSDLNVDPINGGDDPGETWDEAGESSATGIAELFLLGSTTLEPDEEIVLQGAYDNSVDAMDLNLTFRFGSSGFVQQGIVEYFVLLGDMNNDGEVDDLDVPLFVQALTNTSAYEAAEPTINADIAGDFDGNGILDTGDIAGFSAAVSAATGSGAAVPEPASFLLLLLGLTLFGGAAVRRSRP